MATETKAPAAALRGGSFLIEDHPAADVFTPGDFTEEQRMIGETSAAFMENEMLPRLPEILALKWFESLQIMASGEASKIYLPSSPDETRHVGG